MSRAAILLLIGALISPHSGGAQVCTPPEHPYFEYQVERPAKFVGDTAVRPRPKPWVRGAASPNTDPAVIIAAFIVDSLGTVQEGSLHMLKSPSREASAAVRAVYTTWKFEPAIVGGCRVAQLVQTEVER